MLKENQVYNFKYLTFDSFVTIVREMPGRRWVVRNSNGQVFTQPSSVILVYIEKGIYTLTKENK